MYIHALLSQYMYTHLRHISLIPPPEMKPVWWPEDIPWQNVRSDVRTAEKKKEVPWTEGLRRIVIACYLHHGRLDLLPEFSAEHLHQTLSPEAAQQIQIQLERIQQQHGGGRGGGGGVVSGGGDAGGSGGGGVNLGEGGGGSASSSQQTGGDNQQVFTVDTGIGNCDNAGMPTLADATLAEAAAKLQQVRQYGSTRDGHGLGSMAMHLFHHCFSFSMRFDSFM